MFGIENYFVFVITGIILNVTPGTDTVYILSRGIAQGKEAGIYAVLGISTGNLIHTVLASFGITILLLQFPVLFEAIKYCGAAYLIYSGIRMQFGGSLPLITSLHSGNVNLRRIYHQAVFTNVMNPKVALFFLSFLPQFVRGNQQYGPLPFLLLGLTFVVTGTIWCFLLVHFAFKIIKVLNGKEHAMVMTRISGLIFIILGVNLSLYENN